ncbi:copper amine oxidase N-terminal domain-containing protein [Ammoniphilus sp. YIM 78166]|uniref:copper amine oxidase N-terminal domain-containing protein n=1 Tax=Ammoniphilus sp. YIM 78166 TaxID=1644106 RepID=UPI0014306C60|nr:copper amine oxidase N-terminal domain-containing protein [Ammoniphilus sp. YIM 78166]
MKTKWFSFFLMALTLLFGFSGVVMANDDKVKVIVNSNQIHFDVDPIIQDGRTLAAVRHISQGLGASVEWQGNENKVILHRAGVTITMRIGHDVAHVNNRPVKLDVPPLIVNGRTFLPVRFLAESFQEPLFWDQPTKTVYIGIKN